MPRNQGLAVEMTLRGRKSVILTRRSSRCPRSLETRTERGFPHFHSNGCGGGPICQNYKIRQNRKGLQILVQNPNSMPRNCMRNPSEYGGISRRSLWGSTNTYKSYLVSS